MFFSWQTLTPGGKSYVIIWPLPQTQYITYTSFGTDISLPPQCLQASLSHPLLWHKENMAVAPKRQGTNALIIFCWRWFGLVWVSRVKMILKLLPHSWSHWAWTRSSTRQSWFRARRLARGRRWRKPMRRWWFNFGMKYMNYNERSLIDLAVRQPHYYRPLSSESPTFHN